MIDPMVLHHEVKVETNSIVVMGTTTKQWAISKQGSGRPENEYLSRTTTGDLLIKLSLSLSHSHPWAEDETLISTTGN
jgi:hypothetical protein